MLRAAAIVTALLALLGTATPVLTLEYVGRWETVQGRTDGRFDGSSMRDYHAGDSLTIAFYGTGFRIYGVTGPTGGHAAIAFAPNPVQTVSFYSPQKATHVLVYESPRVPPARYAAAAVVLAKHDAHSRGNYVNIDEVQPLPPSP